MEDAKDNEGESFMLAMADQLVRADLKYGGIGASATTYATEPFAAIPLAEAMPTAWVITVQPLLCKLKPWHPSVLSQILAHTAGTDTGCTLSRAYVVPWILTVGSAGSFVVTLLTLLYSSQVFSLSS